MARLELPTSPITQRFPKYLCMKDPFWRLPPGVGCARRHFPMTVTPRKLAVFPAFHKVDGRRVVVVGGGAEAAAKIRLLAETKAEIVVFAADARQGDRRRPDRRPRRLARRLAERRRPRRRGAGLRRHRRSRRATAKSAALAREAGVPVNVVDRPELCDFYTPAIVNRAPLAVAVGSEGVGAGAVAPCPRAHRGAACAGLRRSRRPRRAAARAGRAGAVARSPSAAASGRASFPAPVAEKVFAGRIGDAEARGGRGMLEIDADRRPAMSRWSAPVPAPRTC